MMLCISFMHSSSFYSVSFCKFASVPSSSSRFRATSFKSSFKRLSPRVHCSNGEMLPYQKSSSVFITTSAYRNSNRIPEFPLDNTVTVLFHFSTAIKVCRTILSSNIVCLFTPALFGDVRDIILNTSLITAYLSP